MSVHTSGVLSRLERVPIVVPIAMTLLGGLCFHVGVLSYTTPLSAHAKNRQTGIVVPSGREVRKQTVFSVTKATAKKPRNSVNPSQAISKSVLVGAAVKMTPKSIVKTMPRKRRSPRTCPPVFEVYFGVNQRRPRRISRWKMRKLVRWLSRHRDARLIVQGHTDSKGKAEYNLLLSFYRAKAVASLLHKKGLSRRRVRVRALGDEGLTRSRRNAKRRKERRVSFLVVAGRQFRHCPAVKYEGRG